MTTTAATKERPILFNGPMVRATRAGRKTHTRRPVKISDIPPATRTLRWENQTADELMHVARCPFGKPGDRLWVRETFLPDPPQDGSWDYYSYTDGLLHNLGELPDRFRKPKHCIYKASWTGLDLRWMPSIHMPRWASRLTLEVVRVWVERVQDISEADAITEGAEPNWMGDDLADWSPEEHGYMDPSDIHYPDGCECSNGLQTPREWFAALWDSIYGKTFPWAANPWVWCCEFKRVTDERQAEYGR